MSFYRKPNGEVITLLNKRPRNLSRGGLIASHPSIPKKDLDDDVIRSDLEAGSLVVPVSVVPLLKGYKGPVTGPKQKQKENLVRAITMPGEVVVHRRYAKKVERFLQGKGVRLPLGS